MAMSAHRFRKDLVAGSYDLIVLDVLRDGPAYGYGIRRRIFEQSKHTLLWRSATIYNVLHDLQRQRLVTSDWRGRVGCRQRRYYALTARGRRVWQEQRREWRVFVAAVNVLIR
jgi:DNA-binding PadR family transcriptional regulator